MRGEVLRGGGPKGEMEGIGARGPLDVPEPPKIPLIRAFDRDFPKISGGSGDPLVD